MIWFVSAWALEPCGGWRLPHVVEGEFLSVEYDSLVDEHGARFVLDAAEEGRAVYVDMGFPAPLGAPAIAVTTDLLGRAGYATTELCGEAYHARLNVFEGGLPGDGGRVTAIHEVFHAVQYAYDPTQDFTAHYIRWPWWLEGSAQWAHQLAAGNPDRFDTQWTASRYLDQGHLALHQDATAAFDPARGEFLYGTFLLVSSIAETYGPETIGTLTQAGVLSGDRVWLPDLVTSIDLDFDALWLDHLRRLPTVDHPLGSLVNQPRIQELRSFDTPQGPDVAPQGLGWTVHQLRLGLEDDTPLELHFEGAVGARWHVAVVTANRNQAGAAAQIVTSSVGSPVHLTFPSTRPLWVVVSPEIDSDEGQDYTLEVRLEETSDDDEGACGCASSGFSAMLPKRR